VTVRIVLDTSALLAYARLSGVAVGELIAMVEEDGGAAVVGIPAGCFLEAHAELAAELAAEQADAEAARDRARLVDLATTVDGVTAVLPLLGADVVAAAEDGHAAVEVRRHGALLATYEGRQARRNLPDEAVLDL
jgi:hypothetical protein